MNNQEKAQKEFDQQFAGISDLDNYGTASDMKPAIEWEDHYGSHWETFETEEDRSEALEAHDKSRKEWITNRVAELVKEKTLRTKEIQTAQNTIGNLFPELANLKIAS